MSTSMRFIISRALLRLAICLLEADKHRYVSDPEHKNKPKGGRWRKTPRGWTTAPLRERRPGQPPAKAEFKPLKAVHMAKAIANAKASVGERDRWRVDAHATADYRDARNYATKGGSCVAIKPNGDIVSVCRHEKSNERGADLLRKAVANGGDRLDAFGPRLFGFYTRNGFEPVAVTKFDRSHAPEGWDPNKDRPEDIVFYRYTGREYTGPSFNQFIASSKPMPYEDARAYRDSQMRRR